MIKKLVSKFDYNNGNPQKDYPCHSKIKKSAKVTFNKRIRAKSKTSLIKILKKEDN